MRLVLLQDHLRTGGTEQQSLAIARGLAQRGLEVHLIVFRKGGRLDSAAATLPGVSLHFLKQGPLKTDWFAPGLARLLTALDPHVVLPMGRMANCHAGLLAHNQARPYLIVATFRTGRPIPLLYRYALRQADHLLVNSQEALRRLREDYRIHRPDASSVIYNGCLLDFASPPSQEPGNQAPEPLPSPQRLANAAEAESLTPETSKPKLRCCSVSLFRPQKKQIRLLRLCAQLPETLDWSLTLAGDGPARPACQAEARRLGISQRVSFPGILEDPRPLYRDSDLALHASDRESLPNFLVEAQMAGLPVIAYDVNGVGETFLPDQSGFLVPHRDEAAFLHALKTLAQDPDRRRQFATAARAYARARFSLDAQSEAYLALLRQLAP